MIKNDLLENELHKTHLYGNDTSIPPVPTRFIHLKFFYIRKRSKMRM